MTCFSAVPAGLATVSPRNPGAEAPGYFRVVPAGLIPWKGRVCFRPNWARAGAGLAGIQLARGRRRVRKMRALMRTELRIESLAGKNGPEHPGAEVKG
jgi:hypothetical protein